MNGKKFKIGALLVLGTGLLISVLSLSKGKKTALEGSPLEVPASSNPVVGIVSKTDAGDSGCFITIIENSDRRHDFIADFKYCGKDQGGDTDFLKHKVSVKWKMSEIRYCVDGVGCDEPSRNMKDIVEMKLVE